jgi:hypothetical protein
MIDICFNGHVLGIKYKNFVFIIFFFSNHFVVFFQRLLIGQKFGLVFVRCRIFFC